MSKELEAWKRLHSEMPDNYWYGEQFDKDEEIIKKGLKRLEELENDNTLFLGTRQSGKTLTLLSIAKSLKALEIIKENIKHFIDFEDSTNRIYIDCSINCKTQEEYDLLKEVLL